jgi:hypothetical protein
MGVSPADRAERMSLTEAIADALEELMGLLAVFECLGVLDLLQGQPA